MPGMIRSCTKMGHLLTGVAMMKQDAVAYHSRRATHELDLGLIASTSSAARAHLQLASLHMSRVRELSGALPPRLGIVD